MSLCTIRLAVVVSLLLGCGGDPPRPDEPTTAKDKQRRDHEAGGDTGASGGKWAGWRYTGDRKDCFFVVRGQCFKSEAAACAAARCGKKKCEAIGGGPARVACAK
jgi:hypothetical protein